MELKSSTSDPIRTLEESPWWSLLADYSFFLMFVVLSFPETIMGEVYIGPFPIYFFVFYIGLFGYFVEQFVSYKEPYLSTKVLGCVLLLLLLCGILRGNELKYMVIDVTSFLGMSWIRSRSDAQVMNLWRMLVFTISVLLFFSMIGLKLGFISQVRESGRMYLYSIFNSVTFLSIFLPILWRSGSLLPFRSLPRWLCISSFFVVFGLIFGASLLTATRSLLLGGSITLLFFLRVALKEYLSTSVTVVIAGLILGFTFYDIGFFDNVDIGQLGERLTSTKVGKETRWLEVEMLWSQMGWKELLFGFGFGGRFHSPVVIDGSDLALYSHIAIFTFLQKGGVFFFFSFVIIPFFAYLYKVFTSNDARYIGFFCGGVIYFMYASLSSAWEFYHLFLYGCCLAFLIGERSRDGNIIPIKEN